MSAGSSEVLVGASWGVSRGEPLRVTLEPPGCRLASAGRSEARQSQPDLSRAAALYCELWHDRLLRLHQPCFTGRTPTPHPTPLAAWLPPPCPAPACPQPAGGQPHQQQRRGGQQRVGRVRVTSADRGGRARQVGWWGVFLLVLQVRLTSVALDVLSS